MSELNQKQLARSKHRSSTRKDKIHNKRGRGRGRGGGVGRGGGAPPKVEDGSSEDSDDLDDEEATSISKNYSRRKVTSNTFRYENEEEDHRRLEEAEYVPKVIDLEELSNRAPSGEANDFLLDEEQDWEQSKSGLMKIDYQAIAKKFQQLSMPERLFLDPVMFLPEMRPKEKVNTEPLPNHAKLVFDFSYMDEQHELTKEEQIQQQLDELITSTFIKERASSQGTTPAESTKGFSTQKTSIDGVAATVTLPPPRQVTAATTVAPQIPSTSTIPANISPVLTTTPVHVSPIPTTPPVAVPTAIQTPTVSTPPKPTTTATTIPTPSATTTTKPIITTTTTTAPTTNPPPDSTKIQDLEDWLDTII